MIYLVLILLNVGDIMANLIVRMNSVNEILSKRRMQNGGEAQVYLTKECAKAFNNYTPFLTGRLKDMDITIGVDTITYYAPYARIQFYTNAGKGREGTSKGGLRGKRWDRRCWNDKAEQIVKSEAMFCGGHV